jgi:hypothetical protein
MAGRFWALSGGHMLAIPVGPIPQTEGISALGDRFHEFDPPCVPIGLSSEP